MIDLFPEQGLYEAALRQVGQEGEPEGVVAPGGVEGGVEQEESERGDSHGEEHTTGGGSSDVDTVPDEGSQAAEGDEECPGEVGG